MTSSTATLTPPRTVGEADLLPAAGSNLARVHGDRDPVSSWVPRQHVVVLQRHATTLQVLAGRCSTVAPASGTALGAGEHGGGVGAPSGARAEAVTVLDGGRRPAEIARLIGDLRVLADDALAVGARLATGQVVQDTAVARVTVEARTEATGRQHDVIGDDGRAAEVATLAGRLLLRAAELLERVELTPAALRADLAGPGVSAARLSAAAQIIRRATDLSRHVAGIEGDHERRPHVSRAGVDQGVRAAGRTR